MTQGLKVRILAALLAVSSLGGPVARAQPGGVAEYDAYPHPFAGNIQVLVADIVNNRGRRISTPAVHVAP